MRRRYPEHPASARAGRARAEPPNPLRRLSFALAAAGLGATAASIAFARVDVINRFGPNIASESFGILITLTVVQRLIDRTERWRRLRGSLGALRRSGRSLTRFVDLWAALVKGSLPAPPARTSHDPAELFLPRFTECLGQLDPRSPLLRQTLHELAQLAETLGRLVGSQALALDVEYVELVDDLVDSPFLELLRRLADDDTLTPRQWTVRVSAARADRDAFFHTLLAAVECHNRIAAEAARVRSRRTVPRTGAIGVELPLDHDLKVLLALDTDWWRAAPAPGALRPGERAAAPARLVL